MLGEARLAEADPHGVLVGQAVAGEPHHDLVELGLVEVPQLDFAEVFEREVWKSAAAPNRWLADRLEHAVAVAQLGGEGERTRGRAEPFR